MIGGGDFREDVDTAMRAALELAAQGFYVGRTRTALLRFAAEASGLIEILDEGEGR